MARASSAEAATGDDGIRSAIAGDSRIIETELRLEAEKSYLSVRLLFCCFISLKGAHFCILSAAVVPAV